MLLAPAGCGSNNDAQKPASDQQSGSSVITEQSEEKKSTAKAQQIDVDLTQLSSTMVSLEPNTSI